MHSICCSEKRGGCCCLTLGIIKKIPPPPTFCVCDTNESESVEIFMHKKKKVRRQVSSAIYSTI